MTKLEICSLEGANQGQVYLYPEGAFYKAYQQSAWLLCTKVHPFKVSARPLKGLDGPLLTVGFPMSSFDKFARGLRVEDSKSGGKTLYFDGLVDMSGYSEWASSFEVTNCKPVKASYNSLPVYGEMYRFVLEMTDFASRLNRNFRYSLGEDVRKESKRALLCVILAGKSENRLDNIHSAYLSMLDIQLSLRMLNELKELPDKRYVSFMEQTDSIVKQLVLWERSERVRHTAGVPVTP